MAIICGYQGVGKSSIASHFKNFGFIDLESSSFFTNGVRHEDWYQVYCQIAEKLSRQGFHVFMSSHKVVRDYLSANSKEKLILVYPSKNIKEDWVRKLSERYFRTRSDKDRKALTDAADHFNEQIEDLRSQKGFIKIELNSAKSYTLYPLVVKAIHGSDSFDIPEQCKKCFHRPVCSGVNDALLSDNINEILSKFSCDNFYERVPEFSNN